MTFIDREAAAKVCEDLRPLYTQGDFALRAAARRIREEVPSVQMLESNAHCAVCGQIKGGGNCFCPSSPAQPPSPVTDAEVQEIEKRHDELQTKHDGYQGTTLPMLAWGPLQGYAAHEDRATLLRKLAAPQPSNEAVLREALETTRGWLINLRDYPMYDYKGRLAGALEVLDKALNGSTRTADLVAAAVRAENEACAELVTDILAKAGQPSVAIAISQFLRSRQEPK